MDSVVALAAALGAALTFFVTFFAFLTTLEATGSTLKTAGLALVADFAPLRGLTAGVDVVIFFFLNWAPDWDRVTAIVEFFWWAKECLGYVRRSRKNVVVEDEDWKSDEVVCKRRHVQTPLVILPWANILLVMACETKALP